MDASQTNGHARDKEEQGVTSASLRLTLPITHFVRNGGDALVENDSAGKARRTHCVSTRVNKQELAALLATAQAQHLKLGTLLRETYFASSRPSVPPVNVEKWTALGKTLTALTALVGQVNSGQLPESLRTVLGELLEEIHSLRADLVGQMATAKGEKT